MNTPFSWDDAHIHAYVDGELDPVAAARLEVDSRADPALALRITRQRELQALLRGAFDPVLNEPIPQQLRDALAAPSTGAAVPIGAARKNPSRSRPAWSMREWSAMAATLVLGALLGPLLLRGPSGLPIETVSGRLVATAYLDQALTAQPSGAAQPIAAAHVGLSFRAAAGQYCRSFALHSGANGLACRRAGRWAVEVLESAPATPATNDGFRQASSALSPALLGAIESLGAGDPLTPAQEQQRLRSGWDSPGP